MSGPLPERAGTDGRIVVRRLREADAETITAAVTENVEHLRPWLPWAAAEPLGLEARRALLWEWESGFHAGTSVHMGLFVDGALVGGGGLHGRIGPGGLEVGYWVAAPRTGQGLATELARRRTTAALTVPAVTHVEIHHDRANRASARVPEKLGFRLMGEFPDLPVTPAEEGIECRWRMHRSWWPVHPG